MACYTYPQFNFQGRDMRKHVYLTQENIVHALAQHAITELEANKLLQRLDRCAKRAKR